MIDLGKPANDEMVQGYTDGLDLDSPEPSSQRSRSYRHGFSNGREDRGVKKITFSSLEEKIAAADRAMAEDEAIMNGVFLGRPAGASAILLLRIGSKS